MLPASLHDVSASEDRVARFRALADRVRRASRRYRDDLGRYTQARLSQAESDVPDEWPYFLGWSLAISVGIIGGVQLVEWVAISTGNQFTRAVGVGFGLILGGLGIALLAWIYWRIQLDPEERKPYVVAMLSSLATVGVCTAAFAGLTTMLWQHGVITAEPASAAPGLWRVEAYYLWHLIDAVPLLSATEAVRWERPVVFSDPWSGGLLLAFKVLLLIPLLRVILSGFRLVQSIWLSLAEHASGKWRKVLRDSGTMPPEKWTVDPHSFVQKLAVAARGLAVVIVLIGLPLVVYGVLVLVVRRSSLLDRWVADHVPGELELFGVSASTSWLPIAMDVAGAWLVLAIAWGIADELMTEYEDFLEKFSTRRTVTAIFLSCWLLLLATMAAGAVTLTLLHAGPAKTDAQLLPSEEVSASIQWYAWHLADTIPVLDVPETLNWTIDVEFVDRWSGMLLVLMRIVLIAVLLVPFALFSRLAVRHASRRQHRSPQLDAAGRFVRIFDLAQSDLDQAQQQLLASRTGPREPSGTDYYPAVYRATRTLPTLENELEQVIALFGDGEVIDAGRTAIAALDDRAAAIIRADRELFRAGADVSRIEVIRQSLEQSRLTAVGPRDEYERLVTATLRTASNGPLTASS
jgi:hypothetical protein